MDRRRKLIAAYHEAGHAVVAFHLGAEVNHVEIQEHWRQGGPGGEPGGWTNVGPLHWKDRELADPVMDRVTILLAGLYANRRRAPRSCSSMAARMLREASGDYNDINKVLEPLCLSKDNSVALIEALERRTRALLDDPAVWTSVERVAAALLKQNRLSGAELRACITGSERTPPEPGRARGR